MTDAPHPTRRRLFFTLLGLLALAGLGGWYAYSTRADVRLARGRAAVKSGDYATVDAAVAALEASGMADHAAMLRGEDLFAKKSYGRAIEVLNGVDHRGPFVVDATLLAANCLLELKRPNEAEGMYAYVLQQRPDDADAHRGLAAIAYDLGNLPQAGAHLDRVAELDRVDGRSHRLKGLIHLDLEQNELAEEAYREALRRTLKPVVRAEVQLELARALVRLIRHAEALAVLDERAKSDAETDESRTVRAEALAGLGRGDEAAVLLDEILTRSPKDAKPYALRSMLYLDAREPKKAVGPAEAASRLAPTDHLTRAALSRAYAAADRPADAKRELARAEELRTLTIRLSELGKEAYAKPRDPEVRRRIAAVCDRLEKPELAAMWRRAAEALEEK